MGGYGSTRWNDHMKKFTVEDCYNLDLSIWIRERVLREDIHTIGNYYWQNFLTGEQTASIGYEINTLDSDSLWVRLYYRLNRTSEKIDYKVRLTTTRPNFGGLRWWFICPLVINNRYCNRRVGKIHLPPGGSYYGCRHCYDLTYVSCQESYKRLS